MDFGNIFLGLDNTLNIYYYEKLREKLNSVVYYLNKSISALDGIDSNITKNYNIEDAKVSNVNVNSICENLRDRVSYLNNTVIPLINSKINSLK